MSKIKKMKKQLKELLESTNLQIAHEQFNITKIFEYWSEMQVN